MWNREATSLSVYNDVFYIDGPDVSTSSSPSWLILKNTDK